jgi:hypothetical protein
LSETAKWARFLGIVSLIALVLLAIVGIYSVTTVSKFEEEYGNSSGASATAYGMGTAIGYLIIFLIYVYPIISILRFAGKMRQALNGNDQHALNASFQNLKTCFRYIGIVTIIFLALMFLSLIFTLAGSALSS